MGSADDVTLDISNCEAGEAAWVAGTDSTGSTPSLDGSKPFEEQQNKAQKRESDGQILWHHAKGKVMGFVDFSLRLHTLRDHTAGNHTLDPKRLKLICRLGSAHTSVLHL